MITIKKDRTVYMPYSDRHIGFENDHLVETRYFELEDTDKSDFSFKLDIGNTFDIIDLTKSPHPFKEEAFVLKWTIARGVLNKGVIKAQLRAFNSDDERVWHSAIMEFVVEESINATTLLSQEKTITELEQLEERVTVAVENAESSALTAATAKEIAIGQAAAAKENADALSAEIVRMDNAFLGVSQHFQELDDHLTNMDNPHTVTASQVGAYTKAEAEERFLSRFVTADLENRITGVEAQIGDIDVALDGIIALQNELAGGGV